MATHWQAVISSESTSNRQYLSARFMTKSPTNCPPVPLTFRSPVPLLNSDSSPDSPAIAEVDIWTVDLDSQIEWEDYHLALLDSAERARAERSLAIVRRRFIATRGSLRRLLGRYLNLAPARVALEYDPHGKPRLAGDAPGWSFNISHSDHQALFAVGWNLELGVDLEILRVMRDLPALAVRVLAPVEWAHWNSLEESRKADAFFDYWVCKEAFVKALGRGLGLGLERCVISLDQPPRLLEIPAHCGACAEWSLHRLPLGPGRSGALCARIPSLQMNLLEFPSDGCSFS